MEDGDGVLKLSGLANYMLCGRDKNVTRVCDES